MIKIENIDVYGFESAIRGMRNPMNSWNKSDTIWGEKREDGLFQYSVPQIGENDMKLMKSLFKGGTEHRKYLRFINVTFDCVAPLYFWKEFDTYKIGTNCNSCSTMHKIHAKEFELDDFSHEHLSVVSIHYMHSLIEHLNFVREVFLADKTNKGAWWQMIQLLPSSYNQKRTVQINYEVAVRMIQQRKNHKLDEWHDMVEELLNLPYMKEIIGWEE